MIDEKMEISMGSAFKVKGTGLLHSIWKARMAYLFLSPLFILLAIFSYYPPISGIYHSFFDWDAVGTATFIGLDNYRELIRDSVFINSIGTMAKLNIPRLIISIVVPFIMAELIFAVKNARTKYIYRVAILLPMVAPGVVLTLIWQFIYDPHNGLATAIVRFIGLIGPNEVISWLGNPRFTIPSLIFMGFPWVGGTAVLIYTSGLVGISTEVIESSVLDGASIVRRIFSIDIPLLLGQIRFFLIFGVISLFQDFSIQVVLTSGGPGRLTYVPAYHMFIQAFTAGRMGYASAIGTTIFLVIFIITISCYKYIKAR